MNTSTYAQGNTMSLRQIPAVLLAIQLTLALGSVRADVFVEITSFAVAKTPQGESGSIFYSTPEGGRTSSSHPEGPSQIVRPDLQPGHQFFFGSSQYSAVDATGSGYTAGAQATVNDVEGTIRVLAGTEYSANSRSNPDASATGRITDTLTFTNSSASPVQMKVKFRVSGTYGHNNAAGAQTTHHIYLALDGYFDLQGQKRADDPASNFDNVTADGWQAQEISRDPVSAPAGLYTGTVLVPPGTSRKDFVMFVQTRTTNGGFANFGSTAAVQLELPPSVTMRSASGVFVTTAFPRAANISTRGNVQGSDGVMIVGFIVNGTEPKKVIIRGLGPSLAKQGVAGTLADPSLQVHTTDAQGNDVIVGTNNDWKDTQASEIQSAGFAPGDERESAIILTLQPGTYTAVLRGQNNGTGNGLVELYDLDQAANSSYANLSTRGVVGTNDDVLIAGVIVVGNSGDQAKLAVRAIGPSLTAAGVAGALQNPTLTLYDENGTAIGSNDNWRATQAAELENAGLAPGDDREAAMITPVAVGNYTAIVRGQNNTSGVGLVEVYRLQ